MPLILRLLRKDLADDARLTVREELRAPDGQVVRHGEYIAATALPDEVKELRKYLKNNLISRWFNRDRLAYPSVTKALHIWYAAAAVDLRYKEFLYYEREDL